MLSTATIKPTVAPTETAIPSITPTLPPLGQEGNPLIWAIFPETELDVLIPASEEAANIIMDRTGLAVEIQIVDSFPQIVDMLCVGEAQIGALNAFSYLLAQQSGCTSIVLTAEMFGGSVYQGQILVRSDSGIKSIADLKGSTFCRRAADSPKKCERASYATSERPCFPNLHVGTHEKTGSSGCVDRCGLGDCRVRAGRRLG